MKYSMATSVSCIENYMHGFQGLLCQTKLIFLIPFFHDLFQASSYL